MLRLRHQRLWGKGKGERCRRSTWQQAHEGARQKGDGNSPGGPKLPMGASPPTVPNAGGGRGSPHTHPCGREEGGRGPLKMQEGRGGTGEGPHSQPVVSKPEVAQPSVAGTAWQYNYSQ